MASRPKSDLKDIIQSKVDSFTVQSDTIDTTNEDNSINVNLALYNKVRSVPIEAQKQISGGRLAGMTDINPMWRIKSLTEQFGIVGIGWYYDIKRMWTESGAVSEVAAFVEIDLYIKINDEWSKPIKGIGGSSLVTNESKGLHTNDDCYKMALTDAISTSCKALGMAADIYFERDKSKYDNDPSNGSDAPPTISPQKSELSEKQIKRLYAMRNSAGLTEETLKQIMMKHFKKEKSEELTRTEYDFICKHLDEMISKQKSSA